METQQFANPFLLFCRKPFNLNTCYLCSNSLQTCQYMPFQPFTVLLITTRFFIAASAWMLTGYALAQNEQGTPPATPTTAQDTATDTAADTPDAPPENTQETAEKKTEATDSTQAPAKPLGPPSTYRYTQAKQSALIATEMQPSTAVWLNALGETFLATWYPEHSGSPKGAALIIPNHNTNPGEQQTIANLHHYLSANGWATLAISLPAQHRILPPARPAPLPLPQSTPATGTDTTTETTEEITEPPETETEDSALAVPPTPNEQDTVYQNPDNTPAGSENANADTSIEDATPDAPIIAPVEPLALARIGAGINYLQAQSQFNNVIIAEGIGAARALRFLQALEADDSLIDATPDDIVLQHPLRAFIIINAEHHLTETPELDIPTALAALPVPLLDIHTQHFHQHSVRAAQQLNARKKALANSEVPVYVTRTINSASVDQKGEHRLTRIIRGFLYQHAQGEKDTR